MGHEMLTSEEAAKYLGVTTGYLYKLTMRKKIPYYKPFGNKNYFCRTDLDRYMRTNPAGAKQAENNSGQTELEKIPTSELLAEISKRSFYGTLTKREETEKEAYSLAKEYVIKLK